MQALIIDVAIIRIALLPNCLPGPDRRSVVPNLSQKRWVVGEIERCGQSSNIRLGKPKRQKLCICRTEGLVRHVYVLI